MTAPLAPGSTFGIYRIESQLGRGGMSVVYLAEDPRLARRVAIKVLDPDLAEDSSFRNRFIRESQLAAGLDHPNIVPVYEAGEIDGQLFIAMRYVQGSDLRTLISREGRLEPERTASLIRPVAGALDAAHRRGLVHRDVKPANVLIALDEGEEHPYLADFGLTKHTASKSGLTRTGTFMGTVDYVAPEQIQGEEVDGRTDEYSLACVLYQCLTGLPPFDKGTDVATLFAHLQDPLPKVSTRRPDLPADLDDVLARGMAKDRADRHPTCTAMMDEFAHTLGIRVPPHAAPAIDPTVVAGPAQPSSGPLLPPAPQGATESPPAVSPTTAAGGATEQQPIGVAPGRPNRGRLAAIVGAVVLAIAAIGVVVVLMGGGAEPEPQSGPPEPTGPSPPTTVSNTDPIAIPKVGAGTPYPSTIDVSDLRGVVTDVNVTINGLSHTFPRDLQILLVGPTGQSVALMERVGGRGGVQDLSVTFDDQGVALRSNTSITSGTFEPSSKSADLGFTYPPPAPSPPHGGSLALFNGTDPNGTWELYVVDHARHDQGQIAGGWSLDLVLGDATTGTTAATGATGATAATAATGEGVIFRDDFSDPTSGWDVFESPREHGLYRDGTYVLGAKAGFHVTGDFNTSTQELSTLGDVRVEVTAHLLGSPDALYGVVCRAATPDSYYYFLIQGDGSYFIGEQAGESFEDFDSGVSPAVSHGNALNRIAIECVDGPEGVTLRLSVNDIAVNTVVDSDQPLRAGATGFRAESRRADMEVAFDDFVVSAPA